MYLYYIFVTIFYCISLMLFFKENKKIEDKYFELLEENCDLRLEKIDLLIERNILIEKLNKYEV